MDYNLEDLLWKCQDCDASAPPTISDYMVILRHQKGHHVRLVDTKTGTILATSVVDAQYKGIELPGKPGDPSGKPGSPPGKSPGKPGELPERGMEISEEGITFLITLPPVAFTMFDAAKAHDLIEDKEMDFDHWVFECIQTKFELGYEMRLMLVNIKAVE